MLITQNQYAHKKVQHHETKRSEIATRRRHLEQREKKMEEERLQRKTPVYTIEENAELSTIKSTRTFLDGLPAYLLPFLLLLFLCGLPPFFKALL
jgi:hypothetical protein